jgi:hypothetical protein
MSFCNNKNVNYFKELLRPKLEVRQDQVEREGGYKDPERLEWLMQNIYLCEGDLDSLKRHPDWDVPLSDTMVHFATNPIKDFWYSVPEYLRRIKLRWENRQHERVRVFVDRTGDNKTDVGKVERRIKIALHERGCNAGIDYKTYLKGDYLFGEAVPAVLDQVAFRL